MISTSFSSLSHGAVLSDSFFARKKQQLFQARWTVRYKEPRIRREVYISMALWQLWFASKNERNPKSCQCGRGLITDANVAQQCAYVAQWDMRLTMRVNML